MEKNDEYCEVKNCIFGEGCKKQIFIQEKKICFFQENEINEILQLNEEVPEKLKKENIEYLSYSLLLKNKEFLTKHVKPNIDNTWTIYDIVKKWTPIGWDELFNSSLDILEDLSDKLEKRTKERKTRIVPDKTNIFKAFELTPLDSIRVVIIGQDPYYTLYNNNECVAIGSSFSTAKEKPIQPSLRNIYEEIKRTDINFITPKHGNLENWQKQGVFLLNISLTTEMNEANAHSKYDIWMGFIKNVLDKINENNPKCIYLLWGKEAQKIETHLKGTNIILKSGHPSPLSIKYFKNNGHFQRVNELLDPVRLSQCSKKSPDYINSKFWGKIDWNV